MRRLVVGSVILGFLTLGCVNHVRFVETTSDEESATPIETRYTIHGPEDVVNVADVRIKVVKTETLETRRARSITRIEECTPYQGTREMWEMPVGLVSLPLSFVFNVTDVLLFGYIPNELVYGYTHWTFAALNPAMNTENGQRVEQRTLDVRNEVLGTKREIVEVPLMDAPLRAALDEAAGRTLTADANGQVSVSLLELVDVELPWAPRRLRLELRAAGAEGEPLAARSFFLERSLAQRLRSAAPLLAVRQQADPSAADWSAAVHGLERLGFRAVSAEMHDQAFQRWAATPERLRAFQEALDTLYAEEPSVDWLPAVPAPAAPDAD